MNIFITGGSGFIGSHLVEFLLKRKIKVYLLVEYNFEKSLGWLNNIKNKNLKVIFGDIRDPSSFQNYVKECDIVINLAALISIPYSYKAPKSYIDTNLLGTFNLLEAAKKYKIKKFIHTSTSEVFGNPAYIPIDENHPLQSSSPYAASKSAADQLALSYFYSYNLPLLIVRPFNTFGPRQSLRAVIPTIILQAMKKNKIQLGNLSTKRDFTYIDDTVNGFYRSIYCNKKYFGHAFNLGIGRSYSIKQIIKIVETNLNKKIIVSFDKKRVRPSKSEILNLVSNNKKARNILKWQPKYASQKNFSLAIAKTIKWYASPKNLENFRYIFDYNV